MAHKLTGEQLAVILFLRQKAGPGGRPTSITVYTDFDRATIIYMGYSGHPESRAVLVSTVRKLVEEDWLKREDRPWDTGMAHYRLYNETD